MPIRLRLAVAFGLAAAALFALGGWLFASGLSSAQLKTIDSQLAAQLAQAGRYLQGSGTGTAISSPSAGLPGGDYLIQVIDPADRVEKRQRRCRDGSPDRRGPAEPGTAGPDLAVADGGRGKSAGRRRAAGRAPRLGRRRGRVARDIRGHAEPGGTRARRGRDRLHRRRGPGRVRAGARGPALRWSGCGGRWPRCPSAVRRRAPESRPSRYRPPGTRSRRWPAR